MDQYRKWAQREYSSRQRVIAIALAGFLFIILIPCGIALGAGVLDLAFQLPRLHWGLPNHIAGVILILIGWPLAMWSIYVQFKLATGTPLPLMPTRKLVVAAPFVYCRNPMTLGALLGYLGIAAILGSLSALIIVLVLSVLMLSYIKFVEEKELVERFGDEYAAYRDATPFIIPRLRGKTD